MCLFKGLTKQISKTHNNKSIHKMKIIRNLTENVFSKTKISVSLYTLTLVYYSLTKHQIDFLGYNARIVVIINLMFNYTSKHVNTI